jgi:antitoxin (DNA-binding transcriptional repressor) of toxin-antitoxin stability system
MVFTRISATELARRLGDVLGRIRYRGESFLIERSGTPVARMTPLPESSQVSLREALASWSRAGVPDPEFADLLERIGELDRPPETSWES